MAKLVRLQGSGQVTNASAHCPHASPWSIIVCQAIIVSGPLALALPLALAIIPGLCLKQAHLLQQEQVFTQLFATEYLSLIASHSVCLSFSVQLTGQLSLM